MDMASKESEIRVQFLGSGDAFGSGGRLQSCILVTHPAGRFLIDCGASAMVSLRRFDVDPNTIDSVFLTHLHGDHFGGLPFFILDAQLVSRRTRPLSIAGPAGTEQRIHAAQEVLFPGSSQVQQRYPIDYIEWANGRPAQIAGLKITPYQVVHASGAPAYALRVEYEGKVITYSGDSEWTDALIAVAQDADLFICEAYYFDKQMKYHLDYRTLMAHRHALSCKRLL